MVFIAARRQTVEADKLHPTAWATLGPNLRTNCIFFIIISITSNTNEDKIYFLLDRLNSVNIGTQLILT